MGNVDSKKIRQLRCNEQYLNKSERPRWSTTSILPEDTLRFDALQSYAVCVGVGELAKLPSISDGNCADSDAQGMFQLLTKKYRLPPANVTLLSSKTERAKQREIISSLEWRAGQVGKDGMLLFSFSGHGIPVKNKFSLAAYDYDEDKQMTAVTFSDILGVITNRCLAKYFVIVLDCCYAGRLMDDLDRYVGSISSVTPWYIVTSCNQTQKSIFYPGLKNGFFSYFFLETLKSIETDGLPIKDVVDSCNEKCTALCDLMRPAVGEAGQTANFMVAFTDAAPDDDSVIDDRLLTIIMASSNKSIYPGGFLTNYCSENGKFCDIPKEMLEWLDKMAKPALTTLAQYLNREEITNTVFTFMSQSLATLIFHYYTEKKQQQVIFQSDFCIFSIVRIAYLYSLIEPNVKVTPYLARQIILCYTRKVVNLGCVELKDPRLQPLIEVVTQLTRDYKLKWDKPATDEQTDAFYSPTDWVLETLALMKTREMLHNPY